MTTIHPLRGWRYAPAIDPDRVLAPPYDVISPIQRRLLADRDPYNIVHLTLPDPHAAHAFTSDPYEHACQLLRTWQAQGVLAQDAQPALYLLRQQFRLPNGRAAERLGFIGALPLAPWASRTAASAPPGGILPHERTFPQAKADRFALLKATGMHDSPIFTLFQDAEGSVRALLETATAGTPTMRYTDDDETVHALWMITDAPLLAALGAAMTGRTLYVADGHHRYETALNYQAWRREQAGAQADAAQPDARPFDQTLTYFTAMEDPGAVILPTHRIILHGRHADPEILLTALGQDYDVLPFADDQDLLAVIERLPAGSSTFGLLLRDYPPCLLSLRPHSAQHQRLLAAHPPAVADLAVAQVQTLLLGPHFGISDDPLTQKTQMQFEPNARIAADHVRSHRSPAVVLLAGVSMAQLQAVADAGCVAPPKATYFYPKLPSGLVINLMAEERDQP